MARSDVTQSASGIQGPTKTISSSIFPARFQRWRGVAGTESLCAGMPSAAGVEVVRPRDDDDIELSRMGCMVMRHSGHGGALRGAGQ